MQTPSGTGQHCMAGVHGGKVEHASTPGLQSLTAQRQHRGSRLRADDEAVMMGFSGGPSGGNGGEGGSVWMEAHAGLNSLSSFRRQVHVRASPGAPGIGSNKHGAGCSNTVITVPPGTVVRVSQAGDANVVAELLHVGEPLTTRRCSTLPRNL